MKLLCKYLFLIALLAPIKQLVAQELQVCDNCRYTSIGAAVRAASPGNTIRVGPGTYTEYDILIDKSLKLYGQRAKIDVGGKGYGFIVKADSVSIQGFGLTNIGHSYIEDYAAIYVSRSEHFSIRDNVLEEVSFGMLIEKSKNGLVSNNSVSSSATEEAAAGNGIHLWDSSNVTITNNELHHLRDGIYFEFVTDSHVEGNFSHNNLRYGLHFMFSNNDAYINNVFSNNGAGVAVMFSKFIEMKHNHFKDNWGPASYGVLLKEIYDATIEHNTIEQNTTGIQVEGSTRITYNNNDFINNGWAVKVRGACYSNKFWQNNFLYNSFDISYNSAINDNSFEGNYWSGYTGYDLDQNGDGDVPYRPVKLFSYIVNEHPQTIILMRSLFIDIINFSEKVSPVFTPDQLIDTKPLMTPVPNDRD